MAAAWLGNTSSGVRRGAGLHYNLGWLWQEEDQFLSIPPEKAKDIPNEVLKLIGYDFGGPYLGFVEEGHPLTLTDPPATRHGPHRWRGDRCPQ